ncbi:hypothetical protein EC988_004053 [Linderina pennispora]|nr:hypothetical protein EC988_004053 [Linderina pennispora]
MAIIGRAIHYGVDLVLVSTALAGIRRSTGLTPNLDGTGSTVQGLARQYLDIGERIIDYSRAQLESGSRFFKND